MTVRECKDLEGNKKFELVKYCECDTCKNRMLQRKPVNTKYIYYKDLNKKEKAQKILNSWECDKNYSKNPTFQELNIEYI